MARLHCLKPLLAGLLIALFAVTAAGAFADTHEADIDKRSAEYDLISADGDGAFQPNDSGEIADDDEMSIDSGDAFSNPEYAADSAEAADNGEMSIDSGDTVSNAEYDDGETTHDPGRAADSAEAVRNPEYAAKVKARSYADPGETTSDPGRAANSGKTADSGKTSIDPGETTYNPEKAVDSDEALYAPERPAPSPNSDEALYAPERPADSGQTADSGRTMYDPGETTSDPGRAANSGKSTNSGKTTDSGKTADSGATTDSGKTADSGATTDSGNTKSSGTTKDTGRTYSVMGDPGETTAPRAASPGKTTDSGKTSIDSGETTDSGATENPENQLPVSKPSAPSATENPENQVPTGYPTYTPANTNYGTLPNKPVSQLTVRDVYTPGKTTGQYFTFEGRRIPIYQGVPARQVYSGEFVWREGHRLRYVGNRFNAWFGVDVSAYQNRDRANQTINWAAAKADGVQFAMIRVGLRGTSTGALREDTYYARNIDGAMAQGIQTGVYIFAQAKTVAEAIEEADFVIARLRGHQINGPVSYDWEMKDSSYRVYGTSPEMATACAVAFCKRVAAAGYTPMVYNSRYVAYVKYDQGALAPYMMWYPQYPASSTPYPYPNMYYQMDYWQFTDSAVVEGIGRKIDANIWFRPKS